MKMLVDSTRGSRSMRLAARNTLRIGAMKSMVVPPPSTIGSLRHACTGATWPRSVRIRRLPAR